MSEATDLQTPSVGVNKFQNIEGRVPQQQIKLWAIVNTLYKV